MKKTKFHASLRLDTDKICIKHPSNVTAPFKLLKNSDLCLGADLCYNLCGYLDS